MIKRIIEYSSIIALLAFILPYSYLYYYYSAFKIDILNYMDYGEVLLSISPWIVTTITFGIIAIIFLSRIFFEDVKTMTDNSVITFRIKKLNIKYYYILGGVWVPLYILSLLAFKYFNFNYTILSLIDKCTSVIFIPFIYYSYRVLCREFNIQTNWLSNTSLMIISLLSSIIYFGAMQAIHLKKCNGEGSKYSFKYNDKVIVTTSSFWYVGQTKSVLFLYDKIDSSTHIFKIEKIDSLVIKNQF